MKYDMKRLKPIGVLTCSRPDTAAVRVCLLLILFSKGLWSYGQMSASPGFEVVTVVDHCAERAG